MDDVPLPRLRQGDLVLVECLLVVHDDGLGVEDARYVLNSLYWLAEKPRKFEQVPEPIEEPFPDVISLSS